MTSYTIGADISKDHIDLHLLPENKKLRVANDRKGFGAILHWIGKANVDRIVYEPTGAYHKAFERFMFAKGVALSKINPHQARCFAKARGKRAKTDRVDAYILAQCAKALDLRIVAENTINLNELKELSQARSALIKDRTAAKNRSKQHSLALTKKLNAQRLKQIENQLKAVEAEIITRIKADENLKNRFDILASIPGLGEITALILLIDMPELGQLNQKQIAALAGVAPMTRQSGRWTGRAFIAGGRASVRNALYMPALVACRFNKDLKQKYQALIKAGKPPKVAITAIMRKLLILANALIRDNRKWRENSA